MEHGHLIFSEHCIPTGAFQAIVSLHGMAWYRKWVTRPRASTLYIIQVRQHLELCGQQVKHLNTKHYLYSLNSIPHVHLPNPAVRRSRKPEPRPNKDEMRRGFRHSTHNCQIAIFSTPNPNNHPTGVRPRHSPCNGAASMPSWPHRLRCGRKSFGGRF